MADVFAAGAVAILRRPRGGRRYGAASQAADSVTHAATLRFTGVRGIGGLVVGRNPAAETPRKHGVTSGIDHGASASVCRRAVRQNPGRCVVREACEQVGQPVDRVAVRERDGQFCAAAVIALEALFEPSANRLGDAR